jgi:hypothetical protein
MSEIIYPSMHQAPVTTDKASQVIREAAEKFEGDRVRVTTLEGVKEIMADQAYFESYIELLSKGLRAEDAAAFEQLIKNNRTHFLSESVTANIAAVSALSMPMIRKSWPKIGLKMAIPTEAVRLPKFSISWLTPYIKRQDGTKAYLPQAMRTDADTILEKTKLSTDPITMPAKGVNLITLVAGASLEAGDSIDANFVIDKVTVTVTKTDTTTVDVLVEDVELRLSNDNRLFGEVVVPYTDSAAPTAKTVVCTLTGALDRVTGLLRLTSVEGTAKSVVVRGYLTDENSNHGEAVGFDIRLKEVVIGTGAHINSPLPIEFLQDNLALYNIDSALEAVDIISNVHAQKVDREILKFLDRSFHFHGEIYQGSFDCHPSAGYAGSPTEWKKELRGVIDYFANKMKSDSSYYSGSYAIICNPIDAAVLVGVEWQFTNATADMGGVDVNYNFGVVSGAANRYAVVSSDNVPQGKIRMIFIPSSNKQMTFKYYPYTFNVERDYRDPMNGNVPNIMVTRRDTIEELNPVACEITILNNNGTMPA